MSLFLGLLKIAEEAGIIYGLVKLVRPVLRPLFPEVPADHPALAMIALSLTANVFGLGNAATPFGIKAMEELQKLNPSEDTATNSMVMMLALSTASVQLVPPVLLLALLGLQINQLVFPIIGTGLVRAHRRHRERQAARPAAPAIAPPIPTGAARSHERHPRTPSASSRSSSSRSSWWGSRSTGSTSGCRCTRSFVEGAKEGFQVAVRIIPYLVAILFAIAMFRASGAMDFLARALAPVLGLIGFPPEVLPMAIIRPLTGSGSAAIVVDMISQYGEDSILVKMAAVMFGSTETTFYVIAVYFGAVNIRKTRHAVPVGAHRRRRRR